MFGDFGEVNGLDFGDVSLSLESGDNGGDKIFSGTLYDAENLNADKLESKM
jgi:hypothetical protein